MELQVKHEDARRRVTELEAKVRLLEKNITGKLDNLLSPESVGVGRRSGEGEVQFK